MKRSSRNKIFKPAYAFLICIFAAATALPVAFASSDPNQLLAFKRIYLEPVQDNVDGAFREPVLQSFKEVFDKNPRFELVESATDADSVIRTKLEKKTSGTDIEISLIVKPTDEVYSNDKSTIAADASGGETGDAVKALLKTVLKRIPFYGTVTGRDGSELTFDIGALHGLKKNDVIQVSRVDSIKRHPLLKSIVDVQLVPVGSAAIDEVEDTIAFGHVHDEIAGEKIQKLYKVTAIEGRLEEPAKPAPVQDSGSIFDPAPEGTEAADDRPQLGWVGLGLFLGEFSSSSSTRNGLDNFSGSSFAPGVKVSSEIWITKRWFADIAFGITSFDYTQTNQNSTAATSTNQTGSSSSTTSFGLNAGYRYLPSGNLYGPQAFAKIGYYSFSWDVPSNASLLQSSKSYSSLNLGIGGSLPVLSETTGVMLNFNVLLFPSLTEGGFKTGSNPSASGVNFFVGGYHHFTPHIAVRAGLQFDIYSADFDDGAGTTSQKSYGFVPSLLYYF